MERLARYRAVERALFADAQLDVQEHWLDLPQTGVRARIVEAGRGAPLLFLNGGPNAAATWTYLVAHLRDFRCLMLDRPGTGLSEPLPSTPSARELPGYLARLTVEVLDSLGLGRASIVGSSLGGYSALRTAIEFPSRIHKVVLAGCPAFVPGWKAPRFFSLLRTPILGRLLLELPPSRRAVEWSLREMGHHESLRSRRFRQPMLDWTRAWMRDTDTMINDARMIVNCGTWRKGFDPSLELSPTQLSGLDAPVLALFGGDDPVGGDATGKRLCGLLGNARLVTLARAGHLPWLDEVERCGKEIKSFVSD